MPAWQRHHFYLGNRTWISDMKRRQFHHCDRATKCLTISVAISQKNNETLRQTCRRALRVENYRTFRAVLMASERYANLWPSISARTKQGFLSFYSTFLILRSNHETLSQKDWPPLQVTLTLSMSTSKRWITERYFMKVLCSLKMAIFFHWYRSIRIILKWYVPPLNRERIKQ